MTRKRGDGFQKAPESLRKAILSMKRKIDKNKADFQEAPLTIEVTMGDGRTVVRGNPIVQEYRALTRDYAAAIKAYKEITGSQEVQEDNSLSDIRARLRVAK